MKKILLFVVILLVALGVVYKMDVKPEVKEVVKEVKTNSGEVKTNSAPTQ